MLNHKTRFRLFGPTRSALWNIGSGAGPISMEGQGLILPAAGRTAKSPVSKSVGTGLANKTTWAHTTTNTIFLFLP